MSGTKEAPVTRPRVVRVRVSDQEQAWLDEVAASQDRSVSQVLRLALKMYYRVEIGELKVYDSA